MNSSDSAQLCRLCLLNSDDVVNIWKTIQDSTIATILVKHFWFLQVNKNDGLTQWLCQICWIQTKTFHEFYERVEKFQNCYWSSIKSDGDDGNNKTADVEAKDPKLEPDLPMIKCEEIELTSEAIYSHIIDEDPFHYDDDVKLESQTSNNESQPSEKTAQNDDKWKVSIKRKGTTTSSRNSESINRKIREEQNRELNGQIREWFTMKCDICNDGKFETLLDVKRHYRSVHQMIGYLKCCDQKFHRRSELLDHIRYHIVTPSTKLEAQIYEWFTMKCDICPDVDLKSLLDMRRHYRKVHKVCGYLTCCNKKFRTRKSMVAHMHGHTNPDAYRCEPCAKSFTTKHSLIVHIDHHLSLDSRAFKCNLCSSSFARVGILSAHIRNKHTSKNGEKFLCEKCNKNYPSELLLKCHIRQSHENTLSYVCEVCARQFKSKQVLRSHVTSEHSTTPPPKAQCNICGNWLRDNNGLGKHMKEQHHDAKPANCPICNKIVPNKHYLRQHIRTAHGERKHECVLCDKAFRSAKNLKEHVATHTGEDLYKCNYCDKKFKSNGNLYSHQKNAHLSEWTRDKQKKISLKKSSADKIEN